MVGLFTSNSGKELVISIVLQMGRGAVQTGYVLFALPQALKSLCRGTSSLAIEETYVREHQRPASEQTFIFVSSSCLQLIFHNIWLS